MRVSVRRAWVAGLLGSAAVLAAGPARAAEAEGPGDVVSDQVITVTATRIPIETQDAPATVTVIDEKKIADELVTDIKDLVRYEPGISVPRGPTRFGAALGTTGRAGNEGFVVRGIGGNRVLIQVDGVRVPDGFTFGAQSAGRGDYVDMGLVKSVEILRGPASALYGSDGLAGAVSFTTSDPADFLTGGKQFGGLVRAAYSSADDEFAETAILAGRAGELSAMIAYTRRDHKELDNQGTVGGTGALRTIANPQDGESNALLGRIVWEPGGGHKLRLTGEWLDTSLDTNVLTGLSAAVELLRAHDTGKRKRIGFDWSWEGDGVVDHARLSAWWQDAEDVQFTDEDRTPAADRERRNSFENRVFGASGEVRSEFSTGSVEHKLIVGADASKTRQRGLRDGVVPPFGETFPTRAFPTTDFTLAGAFVTDQITLGPVTLYPALRFDTYDLSPQADPLLPAFAAARQDGSKLSPKLGAVVTLGAARIFANYARGFKAPEPGQVNQFFSNLASGYTSVPNPNLRPETSESIEGGVRVGLDGFSFDATAFHADYRNFISQQAVAGSGTLADPTVFQFINLNRVEVTGAEARITAQTKWGLTGNLALAWAKGTVIAPNGAESPLATIDPLRLVAGLGWREAEGRFGANVTATYAAQKEAAQAVGACTGTCWRPDSYVVLDATAFYRVTEGLTLRAGIFNITDAKYAMWNDVRGVLSSSTVKDSYTQPGRNGSVSISYRF